MAIAGQDALTIDGLDMRTYGYNVSTRSGRYSMPGLRGEDAVLPGKSGYTFIPNKSYDPGEGSLSVWCNARVPSTGAVAATIPLRRAQFEANMVLLQRIFTRNHRLSLIQAQQPNAGALRRAYVQWTGWDEPEVQAGGLVANWQIHYTIPKVFWEDDAGTTAQSSSSGTLSLTNFSGMTGVIEDAVLTVAGPITNPRITDSESGSWIQLTGTVGSGSTWTIDVGASTSMVGASSVMSTTTHVGGYRLFVIPNIYNNTTTPQLTLSGSTNLTVTARRKWVSG